MATIDDQASEREEQFNEAARSYRKPEGPKATGACLNCGEVLCGDMRWCDAMCLEDYELRRRKR